MRTTVTTSPNITANMMAYSATSWPSALRRSWTNNRRNRLIVSSTMLWWVSKMNNQNVAGVGEQRFWTPEGMRERPSSPKSVLGRFAEQVLPRNCSNRGPRPAHSDKARKNRPQNARSNEFSDNYSRLPMAQLCPDEWHWGVVNQRPRLLRCKKRKSDRKNAHAGGSQNTRERTFCATKLCQ